MNDRYRRNCSRLAWLVSRPHRKRVAESPLLETVNSRSRPITVVHGCAKRTFAHLKIRPPVPHINASVDGECQGNADVCESSLNVDANGYVTLPNPLQRRVDADGAHHEYVHVCALVVHGCVRARGSRSDEATLRSPSVLRRSRTKLLQFLQEATMRRQNQ